MSDWRKSTFSNDTGGECVELATGHGTILIRDTTDRAGALLTVPAAAWRDFLTRVR